MAIVCMQCALEGFVANDGRMKPGHANFAQSYGVFDDATTEAHITRMHPEPITPEARAALEAQARAILARIARGV